MNIEKLTISQMAQLNHTNSQTLRYYDKEGLLSPWITDENSNYRYYHINQSARLDMIQSLQAHGITLQKIKEHLDMIEHDPESILTLLKDHLDVIDESVYKQTRSKITISRMISNYERYNSLPSDGTIFFEYIPARKIFVTKTNINFFEHGDAGYELMLRELKGSLLASNLPIGYLSNAGTLVRKQYINAGELYSDEAFLFVDGDYDVPGMIEEIPSNMYLCICSSVIAISDEIALANKLLEAARDSEYKITGDYICEVVLDFPGFSASPRNTLCKIQIPVQQKKPPL